MQVFLYELKIAVPEGEFEISPKRRVPSPRIAENSAKRKLTPYTPVMSAIWVMSGHLYAVIEIVPHGYARNPVDLQYSQITYIEENQKILNGTAK